MKDFRTYHLATEFYKKIQLQKWPPYLKDQVTRASSSIVLNLAEGAGLATKGQKSKHYNIAFGSLRECQAVIDIADVKDGELKLLADNLAAHLFRLCRSAAK